MVLSRCLELRFHALPQTLNDPCALQLAWELFDVHQLCLELASGSTSLFSEHLPKLRRYRGMNLRFHMINLIHDF
jgi:hypothetical protein